MRRPALAGFWAGSVSCSRPGANATSRATNWRAGRSVICMTLACRGAMSPSRSTSRSGGLDEPPRRHRSADEGAGGPVLEWAMLKLNLGKLEQYSDVVHTRRGEAVTLRFATPDDAEELQAYIRGLSSASRYKRFL